jgi:hypothetical protein
MASRGGNHSNVIYGVDIDAEQPYAYKYVMIEGVVSPHTFQKAIRVLPPQETDGINKFRVLHAYRIHAHTHTHRGHP